MKTEHKHTPLPWEASSFIDGAVVSSGNNQIADLSYESFNSEADDAAQNLVDAEFIVRACNSHYDLLEALEIFVRWYNQADEDLEEAGIDPHDLLVEADEKARAAIAKAKGGDHA